jgi:hypothetical protein
MTSWSDFAGAAPDLAGRVKDLFTAHRHHTMATLRRDGSPRISGTEVTFDDDELCLGMMRGARRANDLRADGRIAIHSHSVDPPEEDPGGWCGEAKVAGTAIEIGDQGAENGSHSFRIALTEVVLTRIGTPADHLVIESWHQDGGVVQHERR